MPSLDAIAAMQAAVYAEHGVDILYTPPGGASVKLRALQGGGDQTAGVRDVMAQFNVEARILKVRVSELSALAPNAVPRSGDGVEVLNDDGSLSETLAITGDPRREDPRRTEWTLELAEA